jgi:ribosomal protein S18 acetylase RimI-like enzyme
MIENVEVAFRDSFSAHGEDVVRSRIGRGMTKSAFTWPERPVDTENWRNYQTLVGKVDGVVAGRAVLEARMYPFAEIENLEVMPAFRGRGVGSGLVSEAVKQASDLGFLAIHLQTFLNNTSAHALYARHGFLPATQGEMLRMVRFLNYPALSHFLSDHPLAMFRSRPADDGTMWELSWTDAIGEDALVIGLSGGSCQFDSGGLGPGVKKLELRWGEISLEAGISGDSQASKGETVRVSVSVRNLGSGDMEGAFRLLLNPGFAPAPGTEGASDLAVAAGDVMETEMAVQVLESFDSDFWKLSSYPSVSVAAEFFIGDHIFWLSHPLKFGVEGVSA